MIPMNDRAVYFGDGVYDMAYVRHKVCFALQDHIDRFLNSCDLLKLPIQLSRDELTSLLNRLTGMLDDDLEDAMLYFQLSRGTAMRSHVFPDPSVGPNLLVFLKGFVPQPGRELRLITVEDTRFAHCNIKSLNLIPNVLASQKAKEAGCDESVFYRGDHVMECAHSGLSVLTHGTLVTTPLSEWILPSITRKHLLRICAENGIPVEERMYTVREMMDADEVIVTSSLTLFSRVYQIDNQAVGGRDLPLFTKIYDAYLRRFARETSRR